MAENNRKPETNIGESAAYHNEVKIAGQVVNVFQLTNKDITNVTVATNTGAKRNHPKIAWYGEKSKEIAETLKGKNKPYVSITGYIQTSRSTRNGKTEHHQNIVGKTLTGEVLPKSENEVYITGELSHKYSLIKKGTGERQGTKIRVKTVDNKPNYPEITLFGRQSAEVQDIDQGSTVSIIGTVQTAKSIDPVTGKTLYRESIVGLKVY